MSACFYFGPWGGPGHYLWTPIGERPRQVGPWSDRDLDRDGYESAYGRAAHGVTGDGFCPPDPTQPEHVWRLVRGLDSEGQHWTAIGCWDRSCDRRFGSKAVFVAPGELSAGDLMALAAKSFPTIWARIYEARR